MINVSDYLDFTFLSISDHICPLVCPFSLLNFVVSFYTFAVVCYVSMLTSFCIMEGGVCVCMCLSVKSQTYDFGSQV